MRRNTMLDGIMLLWFLLTSMVLVIGSRLVDLEPEHGKRFEVDGRTECIQTSCNAFDVSISSEWLEIDWIARRATT